MILFVISYYFDWVKLKFIRMIFEPDLKHIKMSTKVLFIVDLTSVNL